MDNIIISYKKLLINLNKTKTIDKQFNIINKINEIRDNFFQWND